MEMSAGEHDFHYETVVGQCHVHGRHVLQDDEYLESCSGTHSFGGTPWDPISARGEFRVFPQSRTLTNIPTTVYPRHMPDSKLHSPRQITNYRTHTNTYATDRGNSLMKTVRVNPCFHLHLMLKQLSVQDTMQ